MVKMTTLLRLSAVEAAIGLKKSIIYDMIEQGRFPRPVKIGNGWINAWASDEIQAWIEARKAERDAASERQGA
jgi:prophage regulatory protein